MLPGEGQAAALKARTEGKSIVNYAKEISDATGEDFGLVYERTRQHCKRGLDELKRKVRM